MRLSHPVVAFEVRLVNISNGHFYSSASVLGVQWGERWVTEPFWFPFQPQLGVELGKH